jgi:hypothetical protein
MIRRFLQREAQFLLAEFGAPDWHTLRLRMVFYTLVWTIITVACLGLVAIHHYFGITAMWIAVALIYLAYLWLQRQGTPYAGYPDWLYPSGVTALPPPSRPALPPPGTRALPAPSRSGNTGRKAISPPGHPG